MHRLLSLTVVAAIASACANGVEPNLTRNEVAGNYTISSITLDPQGSLPEVDITARLTGLGKPHPSLALDDGGIVQLLFEDPSSSLLRLVQGTYRTTPTGVTIDLGSIDTFRDILLPRVSTFEQNTDGSFDLELTGSVSRAALFKLVPEWDQEPLPDPAPGLLKVTFESAN